MIKNVLVTKRRGMSLNLHGHTLQGKSNERGMLLTYMGLWHEKSGKGCTHARR